VSCEVWGCNWGNCVINSVCQLCKTARLYNDMATHAHSCTCYHKCM